MNATEQNIYYTVIVLIWCQFFWELVLLLRQRRVTLKNTQVPTELIGIMSQKAFQKARDYALHKSGYSIAHHIYIFSVSMTLMLRKVLPYFWDVGGEIVKLIGCEPGEIIQSAAFFLVLTIFNSVSLGPFNIYYHFVLEQKHGFNNQTVSFYIRDKLKNFVLQLGLAIPIFCTVTYIIKNGGDYFFLYAWFFVMCTSVAVYTIYPDFIAPWFDTYTPLPVGVLKTEIEKVAYGVGFPLYQIFVVDGSKRSAHSNAFIFGAFNRKKIVLFDTLVKQLLHEEAMGKDEGKPDTGEKKAKETEKMKAEKQKGCDLMEVLAIVGHELGHWNHNHIFKKMAAMQATILSAFVLFSYLNKYRGLYEPFGFDNDTPTMIALIIVVHFILLPYFGVIGYMFAILSRYEEFEADRYAKSLGRGQYLKCGLIKLNHDNLGFPIFDPLFSSWHNSHPPLLERLQAIDKDD